MSDTRTHVKVSKERTGKGYERLHQWIDEPRKWLRKGHRIERHVHSAEHELSIRRRFGFEGVIEWLVHIALDHLETANRYVKASRGKPYEIITIKFNKGKVRECCFA